MFQNNVVKKISVSENSMSSGQAEGSSSAVIGRSNMPSPQISSQINPVQATPAVTKSVRN